MAPFSPQKTAPLNERQFNTSLQSVFDSRCPNLSGQSMTLLMQAAAAEEGHLSLLPTEEKSPAAAIRKSRGAFLSLTAPSCPGLSDHWSTTESKKKNDFS